MHKDLPYTAFPSLSCGRVGIDEHNVEIFMFAEESWSQDAKVMGIEFRLVFQRLWKWLRDLKV